MKTFIVIFVLAVSTAQAGVFGVVRHLGLDAFHGVKSVVKGAGHAVKHAAGDVKTVAR